MAILIKQIIRIIDCDKCLVLAQHCDEMLSVYINKDIEEIKTLLNRELTFEMNYERILMWKLLEKDTDLISGLFNTCRNTVLIRGLIHNKIQIENDTIIDVYIENGAEFIAITCSDIDNYVPEIGEAIEIEVEGISCGLLLLLIGWYILRSKRIEILSQYDRRKRYNRDALAEFAGRNLCMMGLLIIFQNILLFGISFVLESVAIIFISFAGFMITVTYFSLKVAFGVNKFEL